MSLPVKILRRGKALYSRLQAATHRTRYLLLVGFYGGKTSVGKKTVFHAPVLNDGQGAVTIGNGVLLGYPLAPRTGNGEIRLQARTAGTEIQIGDRTAFSNNVTIIATRSVTIGRDCLIGDFVAIYDSDFHNLDPVRRHQGPPVSEEVMIGDNVWLGSRSLVLKGVAIGDNSVIGAMSVVASSIPANCLAVGVPAKVIRHFETTSPEEPSSTQENYITNNTTEPVQENFPKTASPAVSIIVPVYNGEKYLRETLESAAGQIYPDTEIVVVDDVSTDGSAQVIAEFARGRTHVRTLKNETNRGMCASVNRAVAACRGDYFLTLGQDDLLPPDHLQKMLSVAQGSFSFIHCSSTIIDSAGNTQGDSGEDSVKARQTENLAFELANDNCISSTGLIVNKRCFLDAGGFDESYRNYGEWLLWIRLAGRAPAVYCAETKAKYRRHESNMTLALFGAQARKNPELVRYFQHCRKEALQSGSLTSQQRVKLRLLEFQRRGIQTARSLKRRLLNNKSSQAALG